MKMKKIGLVTLVISAVGMGTGCSGEQIPPLEGIIVGESYVPSVPGLVSARSSQYAVSIETEDYGRLVIDIKRPTRRIEMDHEEFDVYLKKGDTVQINPPPKIREGILSYRVSPSQIKLVE